jgi:hypothetical protein
VRIVFDVDGEFYPLRGIGIGSLINESNWIITQNRGQTPISDVPSLTNAHSQDFLVAYAKIQA